VGQPEQALELPGIALSEQAQAEATMAGRMLGTPAYAAPEQADGRIDLIDARTDVYGLGAILFEVLTGRPPHESDDTAALLRRIATAPTPHARTIVPTTPPALDAVCAKAMAHERAERYAKAEELARDIERWLADEPVSAFREPIATRLWRRARRHKALVTSSAVLLVAGLLFVSVLAILLEGARERTDQARAEAEANYREAEEQRRRADHNFRQARRAVDDYFTRVSENKLLGLPHLEPLRKELLQKALEYYQKFSQEAGDDPKVKADHATAVFRVATIRSLTGEHQQAEHNYAKAIALYQAFLADAPPDSAASRRHLGVCSSDYAVTLMDDGNMDEAGRLLEQARAVLEPLAAEMPGEVKYRGALARVYLNSALWHNNVGAIDNARRDYEHCRQIQEKIVQESPINGEYQADLALTIMNQGSLVLEHGNPDQALALYREAHGIVEPLVRKHVQAIYYKRLLGALQHNVGMLHRQMSRIDHALAAYDEARRIRSRLAEEHPAVTDYQSDLGATLNNIGDLQLLRRQQKDAFATFNHSADQFRAVAVGTSTNAKYRSALALAHSNIGVVLQQVQKYADARGEHEKALATRAELVRDHPKVVLYQAHLADTHNNLANTLRSLEKSDEARVHYKQSCVAYEALLERVPTNTRYRTSLALAYANLGLLHEEAERFEPALEAFTRALAHRERLARLCPQVPRFQADVADCHTYIANVQRRMGFALRQTTVGAVLAAAPANSLAAAACALLPPDETEYRCFEGVLRELRVAQKIQERIVGVNGVQVDSPTVAATILLAGSQSPDFMACTLNSQSNASTLADYRSGLARIHNLTGNVLRDDKKLFDAFGTYGKQTPTWPRTTKQLRAINP
jgi:serine/threonine-protein kinase